jgi:pantetheine-phosphate adenylyltransferase
MSASHKEVLAIYPGSFDPVTLGHEDIARRTLRLTDQLIIAVAETATHEKHHMFSVDERVTLLQGIFSENPRVECVSFSGLLMDFARERGAQSIIRGLRAVSDFEYEMQMAQMNRELWPEVETVFLTPDAPLSFLSASLVREVAALGGDVSSFVSPKVLEAMKEKLVNKRR